MYDDTISKMHTIRAYDKILSDLQVQQSERDRINKLLQLQLQCTNVFNPPAALQGRGGGGSRAETENAV